MGWISDRHMKQGGSIGGLKGPHKGPLRKVVEVVRFGEGMFDTDSVIFECGHRGRRTIGAERGRCAECGKETPLDVACPTCKVPPGMPCLMRDIPMTVRQASEGTTSTHASRIRKVK